MDRFSKHYVTLRIIIMCPVGAKWFHADRRTDRQADMTKPMVALRNLWSVLSNQTYSCADCHESVGTKTKILAYKQRNFADNGL